MTRIVATRVVFPPYRYPQEEITEAFARMGAQDPEWQALLRRLHAATRVRARHLALPLERYEKLDGFGAANDAFIRCALDLGEQAVRGALDAAGLEPAEVDLILSASTTGVAVPSLEARLVHRVGLRSDVKRVPVFGLGCVAGAAGLARVHDYLRAWPDHVAVLLAVELCSLTVQRDDDSVPNLVASGLFGDSAAAVVMAGAERARHLLCGGPRVVATRSRLYPDSERVMGWDIGGSGFRIVLAASVADMVDRYLGEDVRGFLADHGLAVPDVPGWICHPGGPKVLDAVRRVLDLPAGALDLTWRSLAQVGNLSSVSVLHVLQATTAERPGAPGAPSLLLALGPGFSSELVLLTW
ncbi:type III polyketide synthase [Carbonactinospora thermoautotrophica]|uniref:type III polyketide synthase n=1 Tax=Carbonactinospora thermoautotrophica TaxID=1469144 RepID=UPI0022712793|nr:3-oxoacyl-[acyl-carrier-protein] synthase III C-terminal domain-containing protein [Carbonactinospora thermoautotrophica]MCX9192796.1 type III polyketide synthase [Carbonactinospora thermoautotrophica]